MLYSKARWFAPFDRVPKDGALRTLANQQLDLCVDQASPGYPYVWQGVSLNKDIKGSLELREMVVQRYIRLMECVRDGKALPKPVVRIFVKPEPHKIEKIQKGNLRLIWALPIEYQMLHRTFFGPSLAAELRNYRDTPTKVGMSWLYGGAHVIYHSIDDGSAKIADEDKKGWDISASASEIGTDRDVRWRLCLNPNEVFKFGFDQCYETLLSSYLIFSDGTVLEQVEPGIVRSGSLITISGNSRMQVILKVMYCEEHCGGYDDGKHRAIAIGDDTLARFHGIDEKHYVEWLASRGYKCKQIEIGPMKERSFCSHKFVKHGSTVVPVPTNWEKHRYSLSIKERSRHSYLAEQLFSLMLEYCFVPEVFKELQETLSSIKPEFAYSAAYFQNMMVGYESGAPISTAGLICTKEFALRYLSADPDCEALCQVLGLRKHGVKPLDPTPRVRQFDFSRVRHHHHFGGTLIVEKKVPDKEQEGYLWALIVLLFSTSFYLLLRLQFTLPVAASASLIVRVSVQAFEEKTVSLIGSDFIPNKQVRQYAALRTAKNFVDAAFPIAHLNRSSDQNIRKRGMSKPHNIKISALTGPRPTKGTTVVVSTSPQKKGGAKRMNGAKGHKGGRMAFLQANKFNMDRATFGGRDLIQKIVLSGTAGAQSGKDVAGTLLYSTQIRPAQMIPNVRLGRLMSLFDKFKIKRMRFVFKSSIPSATNAGTMLFVHEPNPNEPLPAQFAAPTAGTLSNYDSHSVKALVPMAKIPDDFKGERNDNLDVATRFAVGPSGGFFLNDPTNSATLVESSSGQFAIFVQDAHNILGSSGTLPTVDYEIGSLFVEYEIEVEVAADNNNLAGGYTYATAIQPSGGSNLYVNTGHEASTSFSQAGGILIKPGSSGTNWSVGPLATAQNGVQLNVQWDGTNEWWGFSESGVYLAVLMNQGTAPTDFGTSLSGFASGWAHKNIIGSAGSVLHAHSVNSTSASASSGYGPAALGVLDVEDPLLDYFTPGLWTTGTGGSSAPTGAGLWELRVVSLPPQAVQLFRAAKKLRLREEKEFDDMKDRFEALIEQHVAARLGAVERKETKTEEVARAAPTPTTLPLEVVSTASPHPRGWVCVPTTDGRARSLKS